MTVLTDVDGGPVPPFPEAAAEDPPADGVLQPAGLALLGWDSYTGESLYLRGVTWALVAGGFWMGYILMSRRMGNIIPGQGGLAIAFLIAAAVFTPFDAQALRRSHPPPPSSDWRSRPPAVFGVLLALEPVFAALVGWIVPGQTASVLLLVAVAMVVAASMGTTLTARTT